MSLAANSKSVLLIDDDELSRAVLNLLLSDAGYEIDEADSGEAALVQLKHSLTPPIVLTDLQMPGLSGSDLAHQLRAACGPTIRLLAMSGSWPAEEQLRDFDGFLLKPFTAEEFVTALNSPSSGTPPAPSPSGTQAAPTPNALDEAIYNQLAAMMPPYQLHQLFTMCLNDVETRIVRMRQAAAQGDPDECRREAHAIKGGAGMIGASEVQSLAAKLEQQPQGAANHVVSFDEIMLACERLRRILVAREDWIKT